MIRHCLAIAMLASCSDACAADYVAIPKGDFVSALSIDGAAAHMTIEAFAMRDEPVTNAEFLAFVTDRPEWRRGAVPSLFAGPHYLEAWEQDFVAGDGAPARQPVTNVSWFAARAYCASEHARLPTWYEWEYVAAADATRTDARSDPLRNQAIVSAILESTGNHPGLIGAQPADAFGVHDMNRLIWEWTEDYAAMFPNADARVPGTGAVLALCGGSALAFADKMQYALMMRVAALSALKPNDDGPRVGFRCARDASGE